MTTNSGRPTVWLEGRIEVLRTLIEDGNGTGHDLAELTVLQEALAKLGPLPNPQRSLFGQESEVFTYLRRIEQDLTHQGIPSLHAVELILEGAVTLAATAMAAGRVEAILDDALKRLKASPLPQPTRQQPPENGGPSWCRGVIDGDLLP